MKSKTLVSDHFHRPACGRLPGYFWLAAGILLLPGCGVFSSSFLSLLDPAGTGVGATIDQPPGFVVITFANNAEIDEQLLNFLESSAGGGLVLTDAEKLALRPRIRLTVRITFTDGSTHDVEFISGSTDFVEPRFAAQSAPDLNQPDLETIVVVCEVQSVALRPGSPIEVFIPVELTQLGLLAVTGGFGGDVTGVFLDQGFITPRFRALQADSPGPDGVELRQNIGVEDLPGPIQNPLCGSVIGITLDGTLAVPFHPSRTVPSFDQDDPIQVGTIGGRFEFRVTIG